MQEIIKSKMEIELNEIEIEQRRCSHCGRLINGYDFTEFDEKIFCDECSNDLLTTCDDCGEVVYRENCYINYNQNMTICDWCYEDHWTTCEDCGTMIHIDDAYWTDGEYYICEYCRDEYTSCERCGALVHNDYIYCEYDGDYDYLCEHCHDTYGQNSRIIHSYNYKPQPIFYGDGVRYIGVELEIDKGGEDNENAKLLLDTANENDERIYIKHDGSINDGFEIVSHPMTIDEHINNMKWDKVMIDALNMDYRSHNTSTCGLHLHVSRRAFGDTYATQDENIAKVLYFVEKHWDNILNFTRRTIENLEHWASRYGIEENAIKTYEKAKGDYNRYRAINLRNDNTIEFRMFRGTLKYSTFIATLQFVDFLCEYCINSTIEAIQNCDWYEFTESIDGDKNAELIEYLRNRNLM